MNEIHIRQFNKNDREDVRRISCETAFLEEDRSLFIDDDEIIADALTLYYTDHKPGSCFVAEDKDKIIGYIIGTKNVANMEKTFSKQILPGLVIKAFKRGFFFKPNAWRLLFHVTICALKGEFFAPNFSSEYPGMLHINICKEYRGHKLGRRLIDHYLNFLKTNGIEGLHFSSMSEGAKDFFLKTGFELLYESKRSCLKYRLGKTVPFYIFGKKIGS